MFLMKTRHFGVKSGIIFFKVLYLILLKTTYHTIPDVRYHDLHVGDPLSFA